MATSFDFVATINPSQLHNEINNSVDFTATVIAVNVEGDTSVTIVFNTDLSGAEETALDVIVEAHIPEQEILNVSTLPRSLLDGKKLAVHASYKPDIGEETTYAVWSGAGDDMVNGVVGEGEMLHFDLHTGTPTVTRSLKFLPSAGRVWIHEAYLKFTGGGEGDYISSSVIAPPSAVQQAVNLDLIMDGDFVKYSPGGPGTGTHGFAATPTLIPRRYSKDGSWNYDETTGLTPNFTNEGEYKISTVKAEVHKYFSKLPVCGDCTTYFSMTSEETMEVLQPYYIEITATNVSDTDWHASVIVEMYRQRTI